MSLLSEAILKLFKFCPAFVPTDAVPVQDYAAL